MQTVNIHEAKTSQSRKLGLGKKLFTFPAGFDNLHAGEISSMFEQGK